MSEMITQRNRITPELDAELKNFLKIFFINHLIYNSYKGTLVDIQAKVKNGHIERDLG